MSWYARIYAEPPKYCPVSCFLAIALSWGLYIIAMSATTPLPVGVGYGVVVGVGFFFAFLMIGISYLQASKVSVYLLAQR